VQAIQDDTTLGGRYRIGGLLGRGGMAEVYHGFDERLHRDVAVKVLKPELAAQPDIRLRFEAEARSAAKLTHPNVVAVFDTGEDEGRPFLVMEQLPGDTLYDRMRSGPVDQAWLLRVAGDVLGALGAAHAAGIIHRDVKPGNILLAKDGCAKVADFGIAKSLDVADADLTTTGQLVGTPAYVAPERLTGSTAGPPSDLYAVGVILYEALAGKKPFGGTTPLEVAYSIRHEEPPALSTLRPDLDHALVAAVETAMARAPEDRFQTAAAMAEALGTGIPSADNDGTILIATADPTMVLATSPTTGASSSSLGTTGGGVAALASAAGAGAAGVRGTRRALRTGGPASRTADRLHEYLRDRRHRTLAVAAGLALILVITLLALGAGAGTGDRASATDQLATRLRSSAATLTNADGAAAPAARDALDKLATRVETGTGAGPAASDALRQLAAWRDSGELSPAAADRLAAVVATVPGASATAYTPPTTAPPAPTDEGSTAPRKGKGKGHGD